jgi:hypothetical protein
MHDAPWQDEVARLLEQTAQAFRDKSDRRAVRSFGTAIAYLSLARERGDRLAAELLAQTGETAKEGPTERFTFKPGELEALSLTDDPDLDAQRASSSRKKRK